jgi:hypothetical protein
MTEYDTSFITKIDHKNRVVHFDQNNFKKITGSRIPSVLDKEGFGTPFAAACEMSRISGGFDGNIRTRTGDILEPVIRSYLRANAKELLGKHFDLKEDDVIGVEEPVGKTICRHDHFPDGGKFGGMVDGYILVNGERAAVLEIKTTGSENKWIDENGTRNKIPVNYDLQASLYAELSGLKKIVFVAGFVRDCDYEAPHAWKPCNDNCAIIVSEKASDIYEDMSAAEDWYNTYLMNGVTPQWDENNADDIEIVDALMKGIQKPPEKDLQELMDEYMGIENKLSEYSETMNAVSEMEKAKDSLKEGIKAKMAEMLDDGQKKVMIEQNGRTFTLSASERQKISMEKLKEDGIYDNYLETSITLTLRFK